jgi:hypothetical protein
MFSATEEGRSWSSYESCGRRLRRRRRVGALSGAAGLVAVVGLALPTGALAQTNFSDATNYNCRGTDVDNCMGTDVAVGDFNGDGDPDLAVNSGHGVSVLLGKPGGGSFGEATNYDVSGGTAGLAVGQFNTDPDHGADSYLDVVVAKTGSAQVVVLLGNGDGTFPRMRTSDVGVSMGGRGELAVGKIDGDDHADLAVTQASQGKVGVMHGYGDGFFRAATSYATGSAPVSLELTDFDPLLKSKQLDLAVANADSYTVSVLRDADGGPPFGVTTNFDGFSQPSAMAVGDFNGNDYPDVAVVNRADHTVSVLAKGNGFYRFGPFGVGNTPSSVAVGNFNRDSDPDLAVAYLGGGSGGVSVLLGDSGANFRRMDKDYTPGFMPETVATGDFDGDSDSDLAVTHDRSDNVSVLLANSGPTPAGEAYTTVQDTPLDVGAPGVLGNDKDPDGDKLTVALASGPTHAEDFTLHADGSFSYTPTTGGFGSDSFQYTVSDGHGGWNVGTVSITVRQPGAW